MTRITVDHVSKQYKLSSDQEPINAVNDVTLQIKSGEGVAILGPSGSGKTTLLRLIAGLEMPDSGAVYYDDEALTQIAENERNIGMVFQEYALIPHWQAQRNIGFSCAYAIGKMKFPLMCVGSHKLLVLVWITYWGAFRSNSLAAKSSASL